MTNEEYRNAKTSVWWDLEKCPVVSAVDPHAIARNIRSALSKCDYKGAVSITAFGDTRALSPTIQRALSSTGIALHHVPSGVKDACDNSILVDMLFWAVDNPAPANYLLISGDRDFANALHQLSMRRYNILLAYPTVDVPSSLLSAAKGIWLWRSLAMGEQLMPTIKNVKQSDSIFDSNMTTNGTYKVPSEVSIDFSKPMLKESFTTDFNRFPGSHTMNRTGVLSDFDQERGQYMHGSCVEWSKTVAGLTNGERHYGNNTYFPETNMLLGTSATGQMFSSTIETRTSSPLDSDRVRSKQPSQNHSKNRLDSFKDTKSTINNSRASPNPSAKSCPPPLKSGFAPGANNVPTKLRNHNKIKPRQPPQVRPSSLPNIIHSSPSSLKNNFSSQGNPPFPTQSHTPSSLTSADLRGDIPTFDKMNKSSDLQQSSNIKSSVSVPISQLLPSEKTKKKYLSTSFKSKIVAQTENYTDAIHVSTSKLPAPQHPGTDISHRVHMRILSLAMETLKQNMIAPIEQNLEDCIKYGEMRIPMFNVREILDRAVEQKEIVAMTTGDGSRVYLPRESDIWQCVDSLSTQDAYPKELWDELYKYLSSHEGYEAMMQSQTRYDAAQKLKSSCLKTLLLGQIIHMLHLAIKVRQWLRPHQSGWSPLSITMGRKSESSSSNACIHDLQLAQTGKEIAVSMKL